MDTLRDDGARKVLDGITTVGEVLKAKQEDALGEAPASSRAPSSLVTLDAGSDE